MAAYDVAKFVDYCEKELKLYDKLIVKGDTDPNEDFYKSLPVCIIDAVFSIGVKYQSVEKAERSFFEHFGLDISRKYPIVDEYTIKRFIAHMNSFKGFEDAAQKAFRNSQRTSSKSGILKAEACYLVAKVFEKHRIDTLDDFNNYADKDKLDADILAVKGQSSGIMLKYLYMLAGKADEVKPDRHVIKFVNRVFPKVNDHDEIKRIISESVELLRVKYPKLTARFLDCIIWDHMRSPKVWVLSAKTTNLGADSSVDNDGFIEAYESFENAKGAFRDYISRCASSENSMFDGKGHITRLEDYINGMEDPEEDELENAEDLMQSKDLREIRDALRKSFVEKENTKLCDRECDDGLIGMRVTSGEVEFFGLDECDGYAPVLHTNMLDMTEEQDYFLHIVPLFGDIDDAPTELHLDLRRVKVTPEIKNKK